MARPQIFSNFGRAWIQRQGLWFVVLSSSLLASISFSQTTVGQDQASNYSSWTNGANAGTGFKPWSIYSTGGTNNGFANKFVGDPSLAGISGMSPNSFGLYANPTGSGAYVDAIRGLSNSLAIGQILQFQWAMNWDSGSGGNKGFNLIAGGAEIFNINNGGSADITCNGVNVGFGYGTAVMTWSFERTGVNSIKVTANDRDGTGTFATNVVVANGAIDTMKFYASDMQGGNQAQPYFNNFAIITGTNDYVAPVITILKKAVAINVGGVYVPGTITAIDNKDGDITSGMTSNAATILTSSALTTPGTYTVTYSSTDAAGNNATAEQKVVVKPAGTLASQYASVAVPGLFNGWKADGSAGNSMIKVGDFKWRLLYYFLGSSSDPYLVTANGTYDIKWGDGGVRGAGDAYLGSVVTGKGWYCFELDETTDSASLSALSPTDADNDGIPDQWEAYFGGQLNPPATDLVSSADVDSDGYPNVDEFTYGANPVSTASIPENRTVKFAVDMKVPAFNGTLGSGDKVIVIGNFSGWSDAANEMTYNATSGLYELSLPFAGPTGRTITYKYKIVGTNKPNGGYEAGTDRVLTLGASGTPQNLPPALFGGLTDSRKYILRVDMSVQKQKGKFDPSSNNLVVRGWNGWASSDALPLAPVGSDLYEGAVFLTGDTNTLRPEFKFFVTGKTPEDSGYELVWNRGAQTNRMVSSAGSANFSTNSNPVVYFGNDDNVGPAIVLVGGDSMHVAEGLWDNDPGVDSARDLAENTDFGGSIQTNGLVNGDVPGSYTLTYSVSDNSGNQSVKTRTVVIDPSAFTTWSGGAFTLATMTPAQLVKYAIGGAGNLAAQGETPRIGSGFIVPYHYSYIEAVVRTDDNKLHIVPESSSDLDVGFDTAGNWTTEGASEGVSQIDVPSGCERKRFILWHGMAVERKFLRLKATLGP